MSDVDQDPCEICDTQAGRPPSVKDGYAFDCPRCGRYEADLKNDDIGFN